MRSARRACAAFLALSLCMGAPTGLSAGSNTVSFTVTRARLNKLKKAEKVYDKITKAFQVPTAVGFAGKLLMSLIKIGFLEMLADDPDYLTQDQLEQALDKKLELFRAKQAYEDYLGVVALVKDYDPAQAREKALTELKSISTAAALVQGKITDLILNIPSDQRAHFDAMATGARANLDIVPTHPENFWKLMPAYVLTMSIQLVHQIERDRLEPTPGQKRIIADTAHDALVNIKGFYSTFLNPERGDCVMLEAGTTVWSENGKKVLPKFTRGGKKICKNDWQDMFERDFLKKHDLPYEANLKGVRGYKWKKNREWGEQNTGATRREKMAAKKWFFPHPAYFDKTMPAFKPGATKKYRYTYKGSLTSKNDWLSRKYWSSKDEALSARARETYVLYRGEFKGLARVIDALGKIVDKYATDAGSRQAAAKIVTWLVGDEAEREKRDKKLFPPARKRRAGSRSGRRKPKGWNPFKFKMRDPFASHKGHSIWGRHHHSRNKSNKKP